MADHTHLILGWLLAGGLCSLIGAVIGMEKGQAGAGFFYGLLLGPLGLLLIAVADDERIQCPVCHVLIKRSARTCPKCRLSMVKLSPQRERMPHQQAVVAEPPRVIPTVPRVVTKIPRIVVKATRAVAKVTQALGEVTQEIGQLPRYFTSKPPQVIPPPPQVDAPEPPQEFPKEPPIAKKAPKFFSTSRETRCAGRSTWRKSRR